MNGFRVQREAPVGCCPFTTFAQGLEASPALTRVFGSPQALAEFLTGVEVDVRSSRGYMWIDDDEGRIVVSRDYLRQADEVMLYLDLVHEVVHLKQLAQGMDLFDRRYTYHQRPTEIEAYRVTLEEARHLELSDEFLREYLRVEWMTEEQHESMLRFLGL